MSLAPGSRGKEGSVKELPEMASFRIQKERGRGTDDLIRKFHSPYRDRLCQPQIPLVPRSTDKIRFHTAANGGTASSSHMGYSH